MARRTHHDIKNKPALKTFGKKLQSWMDRKEVSFKVFVNRCEHKKNSIDESRLSKIINGKGSSPTLEVAERMTQVLGLTLEEFYGDRESSALDKKYADEFGLFRELLLRGDVDDVQAIMRHVRLVLRDVEERKHAQARAPDVGKERSG